jgi:isoleucyl-tRNA synthetase
VRLYLINSPLVKADNLNFAKKGVESVVKEIFLPWYNAYRFLIQNISKYETRLNKNFVFAEKVDSLYEHYNVTDKWIQSALQILIKTVRREQGEYKLYNVIPPLIKFLENLTNWYVRLNRPRIKGEVDDLNMEVSLNVLFDVLLKVNILMSPVVPYITDMMFQNMKLVLAKDSKLAEQSIHHLFIPDVNEQLINEKVTEQMTKVMSIIETARKLRESKNMSLKQPIMSLTVVNKDKNLYEELAPYLAYIREEINVDDIKSETDVEKYVKLEALPNLPVLGPKFKGSKAFGDVKKGITNLTTVELEKFREEGSIVIAENKLDKVDLLISEKFVTGNIKEHEAIGGEKVM